MKLSDFIDKVQVAGDCTFKLYTPEFGFPVASWESGDSVEPYYGGYEGSIAPYLDAEIDHIDLTENDIWKIALR